MVALFSEVLEDFCFLPKSLLNVPVLETLLSLCVLGDSSRLVVLPELVEIIPLSNDPPLPRRKLAVNEKKRQK